MPCFPKAGQRLHQFNSSIIILNVDDEFMEKKISILRVKVKSIKSKFEKQAPILAKNEMKD